MCGLILILERGRPVDHAAAMTATRALAHRGPDGSGTWSGRWMPPAGSGRGAVEVFAGHRRLSILDPARRSDQPLRRGPRTLVYNGEIYNFRALRSGLAAEGAALTTEGDTEVLLELLARRGLDGLHAARGMWAFALFDDDRGQVLAARDRYGKKPLFYHLDDDRLCLASEIAPIQAYLGRAPRLRATALASYLREGWLFPRADGETHIEGIRELPAGCALRFDLTTWQARSERWFDMDRHVAEAPVEAGALPELLRDAVLSRLVADRQVGLLLSGGVDSSLILSILCASGQADRVHCFTGDAGKSEDALYARRCIEQLGIRAIEVPLDYGAAGLDGFLRTCRHQEKPFPFIGNVLAMPQLYARIAEHDVPVVLDGTGGDEVFAGYWDRYFGFALRQARAEGDEDWIARALQALADNPKAQRAARRALADGAGEAPAGLLEADEDPSGLARHVAPEVLAAPEGDSLRRFDGPLSAALLHDATRARLPEWLWQNDRNAMASGVENRSPLLDHRIAPWMRTALRGKIDAPWNKLELRRAFDHFVPLPTQWRRDKQGFRWVYHRFLRHHRAAVLDLVGASRLLPGRVDVAAVLDAARRDDAVLESALLQRMLCIAGLEQAMGLRGGAGG